MGANNNIGDSDVRKRIQTCICILNNTCLGHWLINVKLREVDCNESSKLRSERSVPSAH